MPTSLHRIAIGASYTKTYKDDLKKLIKRLHDEVRQGNMSVFNLYSNVKSELMFVSAYGSGSFKRLPKSKRSRINDELKEKWQPKVTHVQQTSFTALKYRR